MPGWRANITFRDKVLSSDDKVDSMDADTSLDTLLELNDSIIAQELGFWIKIEAWRVTPTAGTPHGVRYSLTLHNRYGTRVLGYDNAHSIKRPGKHKFAGRKLTFDHKHRTASDKGVPYEFSTAAQLMCDFFTDADAAIKVAKK